MASELYRISVSPMQGFANGEPHCRLPMIWGAEKSERLDRRTYWQLRTSDWIYGKVILLGEFLACVLWLLRSASVICGTINTDSLASDLNS